MEDPNCYLCKHRDGVPGSTHSSCKHPATNNDHADPLRNLLAVFASVGRYNPVISTAITKLNIKGDPYGIEQGWFNWPWNFDPVWIRNCDGFTLKT